MRPGISARPSGLGGAGGEGDWRRMEVGVLVSEVVAELRAGTGREDDEGK